MERYTSEAKDKSDVALQLPTGSGKTLVGLLIGEWRRRKYSERIVYLCPTKQLVNQTVEQAEKKYGLKVIGFTGPHKNYIESDVANYRQGKNIAITTYSSVFNTRPFFDDAETIIIDDAHAAENYISKLWSLEINAEHPSVHQAVSELLRPFLDSTNYSRLMGEWDSPTDKTWVDKLPTPDFLKIKESLIEILDVNTSNNELKFPWSMLRSHLHACHLYISSKCILIRPLLPPTWEHKGFSEAKQRIYMSATLGEGGDLERLVGRKNIFRLPTPDGWDNQGVGRRFFILPSLTLNFDESLNLNLDLFSRSDRSLVLVPSEYHRQVIVDSLSGMPTLKIFNVEDIETSKDKFISTYQAVAIVANRYDGIDFPGDECRLLVIQGLPKAVNLQEQFFMSRISASVIFNDRIQTRILQAIGRCTRSLEDYSAVVVNGNELADYLSDKDRRQYFHPELQAELEFGVDQSIDTSYEELIENYEIFIENGEDWENANRQIIEIREEKRKRQFPGIEKLAESVGLEIDYASALWAQDYKEALTNSELILGVLTDPALRGYRGLWEYLAGSTAFMAEQNGDARFGDIAKEHYQRAKNAAKNIPWLVSLSSYSHDADELDSEERDYQQVNEQVENIEAHLDTIGRMQKRKFAEIEKSIRDGINCVNTFEEAHRLVGEHIGFIARNVEVDGSPDPWWQLGDFCIVFEDHADAKSDTLSTNKARQASGHPKWIRQNVDSCKSETIRIIAVLVSPVAKVSSGASPHIENLSYWELNEFKKWVTQALEVIRELYSSFVGVGDLAWRGEAAAKLVNAGMDVNSLIKKFEDNKCSKVLDLEK